MYDFSKQTGEGHSEDASFNQSAPFVKLDHVTTNAAISSDIWLDNIRTNIKRGIPRIQSLPEFKVVKGFENPIALVGGGPSLKDCLDELKQFKVIVACGSVHDYLMSVGVIPTYCTVCDPDEIMAAYLQNHHPDTKYLLATNVHENLFTLLEDREKYLWHCYSDATWKEYCEIEPDAEGVGGGCTIGLRSISLALMFGYSNIHLFGFDSCLNDDEHHAYQFATDKEEIGEVYEIKLGLDTPGVKTYRCLGYQLAQTHQFKDFYVEYGNLFYPTFHGKGLLKDFFDWCLLNNKILQDTKPVVEAGYGIYTV